MSNQGNQKIKQQLVAAASSVFVEKGFREARVSEICKQAGANIAAVNYHFGSKENLYREAWKHSFSESIQQYPPDGGIPKDATAKERLKGQIKALITRISDENNKDFYISQMEMMNPTGLLEEVMEKELLPLKTSTLSLVRDILGPKASEQDVEMSEVCIISMCLHPMLFLRMQRMKHLQMPTTPIDNPDLLADYILKFALAGMNELTSEKSSK
jgi:AcrR family transcriptional regulator